VGRQRHHVFIDYTDVREHGRATDDILMAQKMVLRCRPPEGAACL
jgi:hypothetical protein